MHGWLLAIMLWQSPNLLGSDPSIYLSHLARWSVVTRGSIVDADANACKFARQKYLSLAAEFTREKMTSCVQKNTTSQG
jgi:hypothetical protein